MGVHLPMVTVRAAVMDRPAARVTASVSRQGDMDRPAAIRAIMLKFVPQSIMLIQDIMPRHIMFWRA